VKLNLDFPWLDALENFLFKTTRQRIRRGALRSTHLTAAYC
jgi:hypothetical protein